MTAACVAAAAVAGGAGGRGRSGEVAAHRSAREDGGANAFTMLRAGDMSEGWGRSRPLRRWRTPLFVSVLIALFVGGSS